MAHINLLPWREEQREQRQREFYVAIGVAAMFAIACLYLVSYFVDIATQKQTQRNAFLQSEIVKLDSNISEISEMEQVRSRLIARMQVIQELQESPRLVRVFDALPRIIPEGVHINTLSREGSVLVIEGVAQSNDTVSVLMRELEASSVFDEPRLRVIQRSPSIDDAIRVFTLEVAESQTTDDGGL